MKEPKRLEELDSEVAISPRPREPGRLIEFGRGSGDRLCWVGGLLALRAGTG